MAADSSFAFRLWSLQRIRQSWKNSKEAHKKGLQTGEGRIRLLIAVVLLVLFSWQLVSTDMKLGLSFVFAGSMAIYAGHIYKGEEVIGLVLGGVILASVIPTLFPVISESFSNGDYIGIAVLIVLGIVVWLWSDSLKKGEKPDERRATSRKSTRRNTRRRR